MLLTVGAEPQVRGLGRGGGGDNESVATAMLGEAIVVVEAVFLLVFSCCSLLLNSVASKQGAPLTPGPGQLPRLALDFTSF